MSAILREPGGEEEQAAHGDAGLVPPELSRTVNELRTFIEARAG